MRKLEKKKYKKEFPIHFIHLRRRFDAEVKKQTLRNTAARILDSHLNFREPSHPVNRKMMGYLRDKDLEFLTTA